MKIILSGGGTLGPVTPLIAFSQIIAEHQKDAEFLFVGTHNGPELDLVESVGIKFESISAGKLRRYFSILNIADIFRSIAGLFQAVKIIWRFKPDMCITAGGYNSVPLHIIAWFFGIPCWVHQQDVKIGLANRIMAPLAKVVTVALEANVLKFPKKKVIHLGNPVRKGIYDGNRDMALQAFGLDKQLPLVLVTGGGTGSAKINELIVQALPHLQGVCQILHLTGKGKWGKFVDNAQKVFPFYHPVEFLSGDMKHALAAADVIVARGGFGTLTEIAALQKPSIIVPLPGHQVSNVVNLYEQGAVEMLDQELSDGNQLGGKIREILTIPEKRMGMTQRLVKHFRIAQDEEVMQVVQRLQK
ncbi:UDP-N-acetylglucosamine--N-acetylmuramyl-(pentapeptide) pyrophosphoryl-undecaprenol N-acetylglucosamine transferase [Candidatus Nomurabacteria bacterium]|nr:UDP-N-acetylglucosamine--N-acetylmuramyl-(pentapeptide) pyrophosphoryl-undecaprenol N-acetylglucosamine transferase [Candidatus Nomurabacteria bacterium]